VIIKNKKKKLTQAQCLECGRRPGTSF